MLQRAIKQALADHDFNVDATLSAIRHLHLEKPLGLTTSQKKALEDVIAEREKATKIASRVKNLKKSGK